jgi:hypothetical protein
VSVGSVSRAAFGGPVSPYESGLSLNNVGKAVGADPKTVKSRLIERGLMRVQLAQGTAEPATRLQ